MIISGEKKMKQARHAEAGEEEARALRSHVARTRVARERAESVCCGKWRAAVARKRTVGMLRRNQEAKKLEEEGERARGRW